MATPKENRSWKSGKKRGRKKKANPQVVGLVLTLFVLAAILVWAIWPRPMVQLQLFVISADEQVVYQGERLARYHTAAKDNAAVSAVFAKLAEQVQSVVSARNLTVSQLRSITADDLDGRNRIGIVFLNAFSRSAVDDGRTGKLQLVFGSDRQTIGFDELVLKFEEAQFRELILLLEISHERPGIDSALLAVDGPALLEDAARKFAESHPEFRLTIISSTENLHSSYPNLIAAESLPDLDEFEKDRQVIVGTAFGQTVAKVFQAGDFWTIDDLSQQLTKNVEEYVTTTFRGQQTPRRFATYEPEESVNIFREKHNVVLDAQTEADEDADSDGAGNEEAEEVAVAGKQRQSPDAKLLEFRARIEALTEGFEVGALAIADLLQLHQYADDMQYTLDHADLKTFGEILDQGERLLLQIESAAQSLADVQQMNELEHWIPPIDLTAEGMTAFFSDLLAEVNAGEDQRSASVVEKLKEQESREQLVASFLSSCKLALQDIDVDSPEAKKQRSDQLQDWRIFFQRLAKKAGWHDSEWPHQFLLAADLLRGVNGEWSDEQFKAFLRLQLLRSEGLQIAAGWKLDGASRLYQNSFLMISQQLDGLLKDTSAAERSFLLGQPAIRILEKHLVTAESSLDTIQKALITAGEQYDFVTQQRLNILTVVKRMALLHNSTLLSPEQLQSLSQLSNSRLNNFSVMDFPQASFSRKVSRDDASALLQLTTRLSEDSPRQMMNETQVAMSRFRELAIADDDIPSPVDSFQSPMVHQGIWLGFWSIRALQALSADVDGTGLLEGWIELVQSIADQEDVDVVAAKRAALEDRLIAGWQKISSSPIVMFKPVEYESLQAIVAADLERHAQFAGSRYSGRYRRIFEKSPSAAQTAKLSASNDDLRVSGGTTDLGLSIPDGTLVYFYPDGVRLQNSELRDVNGWQVGPWDNNQQSLKATSKFSGSANPVIAIVDQDWIVQDFQTLKVGVAFEATGWKVRFLSQGVRLPEIDLSDEDKVITLPPQTGENPLPITVQLLQPESSFADSVMVNIAILNESGSPGTRLWPKFQELSLDKDSRSVEIPLVPPVVEGEANPVMIPEGGFDFTNGIAFIVRPKDAADQEVEVVLKVTPKFFNPLDQYLELGDLEFDVTSHKLSLPIRRRSTIAPEYFPPKKIGAEMSFSRDLDPFSTGPPPKRPAITEQVEILESTFRPGVHEAIRISETTIGKDRLEFGLTVDGLENIAKWRLGQSDVLERIGYARSGEANQFGNRTEIRIGLSLANKKEDGVQTHNLDGKLVLGEKWRNAVLDLPLELYGYQAEQASDSLLILNLLAEGNTKPQTLAEIAVTDAYARSLKVDSPKAGVWLFDISSKPHGTFGVNLSESFRVTEGVHQLEATLKDENHPQPIAAYQTEFVVEDSSPKVQWGASEKEENSSQVLTSQDYRGWITVEDPQTGVASVTVGLGEESMTPIDLKGNKGQTRPLKIPFRIEKLFYPEIPAKNVPITKRITVKVQATNSIGMTTNFSQDIKLVQPAGTMNSGDKTGTLLVKMASKSKYDFVLTGAGGKVKREVPDAEGSAQFDDLPEGNYRLNWKKHYPLKNDGKSFEIRFSKTGEVFTLSI